MGGWRRLLGPLGALFSILVFAGALHLLHRALAGFGPADVLARLSAISTWTLAASALFTGASYLALGGFDWLALRFLGRPVGLGRTLLVSFISHAISHNMGFAALTGGGIRYRMYAASGLTIGDVAAVVMFCGVTFLLGASALAAGALMLEADRLEPVLGLPAAVSRAAGLAVVALLVAWLWWGRVRRPLRLWRWSLAVPRPATTLAQLAVAAADLAFAAAALYVLLPPEASISYPAFVGLYVVANLSGVAAHVPGGLGVFETVILLLVPEAAPDAVLGALLVFRLIYHLAPLAIAVVMLAIHEGLGRWRAIALREMTPAAGAVMAFAGGAVLLLDTALGGGIATPLAQVAHQGSVLAGTGLLLLARGLNRRLARAHRGALALLAAGAAFTLLRGGPPTLALIAAAMAVALVADRKAFYRHAPLLGHDFPPAWVAGVVVMVLAQVWLIAFSHGLDAVWRPDSGAVTAGAAAAAGLALLLHRRAPPQPPVEPAGEGRERAIAILRHARHADSWLALCGGKSLLFGPGGRSFISFVDAGPAWIALGDPVGHKAEWLDLAWTFRELAERGGARPVFFDVDPRPLYLDLGLSFAPAGAKARVRLTGLPSAPASPAAAHQRARRRGAVFRVASGAAAKDSRASGPGLAAQAAGLPLDRVPLAVARLDGIIVALAPLLCSGQRHEMTARPIFCHPDDADIEDFLMVEAMRWGCRKGFHWFDLGLAPEGDEVARQRRARWMPTWRQRLMAVGPGADLAMLSTIIRARSEGAAGPS